MFLISVAETAKTLMAQEFGETVLLAINNAQDSPLQKSPIKGQNLSGMRNSFQPTPGKAIIEQNRRKRNKNGGSGSVEEHPKISLKAARVNAGLGEKEAAELIGICRNTLRKYEKGMAKPRIAVLERMEKVYGFPMKYVRIEDSR